MGAALHQAAVGCQLSVDDRFLIVNGQLDSELPSVDRVDCMDFSLYRRRIGWMVRTFTGRQRGGRVSCVNGSAVVCG